MAKLSAIVITKNEELMIEDCLKSLAWADEIVLVDDHSEDKTVKIAKKFGARVVLPLKNNSMDYSLPRNLGLAKANNDWVLYVDADERVTSDLSKEIQKVISDPGYNYYAVPRKNIVLGRELKHGGMYPDYVKRLFKKKHLKGWKGKLHEEPNIIGEIGHLGSALVHIKHETLSEMVEKTNKWSVIEARLMYDAKHPQMNIPRFVTAMAREFWKRMVRHVAFLDGTIGIIYAMYQVFSRFVSYSKLWEMQVKNESGNL
ncbi:MAG: Glycosyl transferase family 2 [Candidatus Woesebacteria bacterium GW2011_GWB1_43_14]|uniref:Glycosyl transferase family 2 n=1 Tax=Candidatus Woesebacteria bacterium GW2011_GWB1_43_14 TaxID=1618578 RepID=A0A0G1FQF5_9BACT|nr:MAG: Glycosyl transferase family 2 [Candidatus Woesebacteria bacterium GW2011_GWA1_39_11b]KKS78321.1 MAG: Glycosyl transferase family 2 [Candidatus Woesebacteria bacterium GW2011_GWC1_42_9]KKS97261.1 MAG: Glycosyl transferase family 2 [Candidatus Woesebacteria bacterium GW2011_GWB1_43_14]